MSTIARNRGAYDSPARFRVNSFQCTVWGSSIIYGVIYGFIYYNITYYVFALAMDEFTHIPYNPSLFVGLGICGLYVSSSISQRGKHSESY